LKPICFHDKGAIAAFLRRRPLIHLYHLGDLDDFFWPYTQWYASTKPDQATEISQIVLLYTGLSIPILLAITEQPDAMCALLRALLPLLPRQIYAHLSEGVEGAFAADYAIQAHGMYYKMALTDAAKLDQVDTSAARPLFAANAAELEAFYEASYPGNWFDARMLETGCYYGIRKAQRLVSVAGIHVYSAEYRVAALGNITTHPDFRGRGLAKQVTAKLCSALREQVDHIGLNVSTTNARALACYEQLGFERIATYGEYTLDLKRIR
jgi:ribosomal protein S18 acetylase RimI-like enzyme